MKITCLLVLAALFAAMMMGGCASLPPIGAKKSNLSAPSFPDAAANSSPPSIAANSSGMKVIGMVGGVSWYSSETYYRMINEMVNDRLGDPHSAKILMYSIEFADVSDEVERGSEEDLAHVSNVMVDAAQRLKSGGADFIIIGSNTMNAFAPDIEANAGIPVLNIADATGKKVQESGIKKVILLGSKIVMEKEYYRDILEKKYGLIVILPNETERNYTNSVVFGELVVGNFRNESKERLVQVINRLVEQEGAQGVILGCTELPLLIKQTDVQVPIFDTTAIHAEAAVKYALGEENLSK